MHINQNKLDWGWKYCWATVCVEKKKIGRVVYTEMYIYLYIFQWLNVHSRVDLHMRVECIFPFIGKPL